MSAREFDELVSKRKQLISWWNLRNADDFSQGKYQLRVDVVQPAMVAFCGQSSPGAKNYHEAPAWFKGVVKNEIAKSIAATTEAAYLAELERLTVSINSLKEEILMELSQV